MKELKDFTFEEKVLRAIIADWRNYYVGCFENAYLDNGEEDFIKMYGYVTKQKIIELVYYEIANGTKPFVQSPTRMLALEKKHLRFMGKKFIEELIEDRIEADYNKNGWDFPNNYEA